MVTKAKAIEILEELSSRVDEVKKWTAHSTDFAKWQCDVYAAVENIFPEKRRQYLRRFNNIRFEEDLNSPAFTEDGIPYHPFPGAMRVAQALVQSMIDEVRNYWPEQGPVEPPSPVAKAKDPAKVFVVHGRNQAIRDDMFNFLRAIGLHPIEWSQAVAATGRGSPYIGEVLDTAFNLAQAVVVLMTPDDEACLKEVHRSATDEPYEKVPTPQARPNVLFEAGMAMGRDADRTVLVEVGKLRPFSDVGGRHTLRFDGSSPRRQDLANRLKSAGCKVNLEGTDWLTVGDFKVNEPKSTRSGLPPWEVGKFIQKDSFGGGSELSKSL